MPINDSSAVLDKERQFPQHQAILTLIQDTLQDPRITTYNWLDLACGKGQIISNLDNNIDPIYTKKISYSGYDVRDDYLQLVRKKIESLELHKSDIITGELKNFHSVLQPQEKFDLISLTNVIHEVDSESLATLIFESFIRLNDDGMLFIYDMDRLSKQELGAVVWSQTEFAEIVQHFIDSILQDGKVFKVVSGQWTHSTCNGWNINIKRSYLEVDKTKIESSESLIANLDIKIKKILERKYNSCTLTLDTYTNYGTDSSEDKELLLDELYNFWSITRALGRLS
ncbi:MAG: class I SAM-dependent methyltransferase [Spirochaetaceae bacterium]